jgi:hypothetical protein
VREVMRATDLTRISGDFITISEKQKEVYRFGLIWLDRGMEEVLGRWKREGEGKARGRREEGERSWKGERQG